MKRVWAHGNDRLNDLAARQGLVFLGTSQDVSKEAVGHFERWLDGGRHAGMAYLANHRKVRASIAGVLDGAKCALVFGFRYHQGDRWHGGKPLTSPRIAMYARFRDYHRVLKKSLTTIADEFIPKSESYRVTVDSVPVLERELAYQTGEGFIGKNTCYIHPKHGSFLLLGEIITTWAPDIVPEVEAPAAGDRKRERGGCGTCKRCQVHCPTGALSVDYQIDARKCLSWWTIENRGTIPREYWPWLAEYLFGCDICQLVCPWNRESEIIQRPELKRLTESMDPFEIVLMDRVAHLEKFAGTPVMRARHEGLVRNALIALWAKKDPRLEAALDHASQMDDEMIRETIAQMRRSPNL